MEKTTVMTEVDKAMILEAPCVRMMNNVNNVKVYAIANKYDIPGL